MGGKTNGGNTERKTNSGNMGGKTNGGNIERKTYCADMGRQAMIEAYYAEYDRQLAEDIKFVESVEWDFPSPLVIRKSDPKDPEMMRIERSILIRYPVIKAPVKRSKDDEPTTLKKRLRNLLPKKLQGSK